MRLTFVHGKVMRITIRRQVAEGNGSCGLKGDPRGHFSRYSIKRR